MSKQEAIKLAKRLVKEWDRAYMNQPPVRLAKFILKKFDKKD